MWQKTRDILACLLWFGVGLALWYPAAIQHKAVSVNLWIIYGASYLILIGLLMWWNWDYETDN